MEESPVVEGKMVYSVVDLFSGAGGLSSGFRAVESKVGKQLFKTLLAVEVEADPAATFSENFPEATVLHRDVRDVVHERSIPECDVVLGGPPCQGFSRLGKGDPAGLYNDLWRSYAQAIDQSLPKFFVMENVPQFLNSPQRQLFEEELSGGLLRDYVISPVRIINCADFGVAQNRKRMVILGARRDQPTLSYPAPSSDPPSTVRDSFEGLNPQVVEVELPPRFTYFNGQKRPGPFESRELHLGRRYSDLSLERFKHISVPGGNRFDLPDKLKSPCWKRHNSGNTDVMGRLYLDRPSVTIRTEFFKPEKGRYLHPTENRAITHFEAIRLMGFPDDYLWVGSKTSIARQIGNAVPPPFAKAVGEVVAGLLNRSSVALADTDN